MKIRIEEIESTLANETASALQGLVNAADMALHLESARAYGLVIGGPQVDQERCGMVLEAGRARKILPAWNDDDLRVFLAELPQCGGG